MNQGHRVSLCLLHQGFGGRVGGRELDDFAEGESVWRRKGLGLRRKKCTAQGGQEEDT